MRKWSEVPAFWTPQVARAERFATGQAMEVVSGDFDGKVGKVFPLKKNNDALADGVTLDRLVIGGRPVEYTDHKYVTGVYRYEVGCFDHSYSTSEPVATLDVHPLAYEDSNKRLQFGDHIAKPKLDSNWTMPGQASVRVTPEHVELATSDDGIAAWDTHLIAAIETAIYKMRTGESNGSAYL